MILRHITIINHDYSLFPGVASTVKNTLNESCVQILSPQRRVDILRDALEFRQRKRQYTITFCGVNGVGKSTNLAKVLSISNYAYSLLSTLINSPVVCWIRVWLSNHVVDSSGKQEWVAHQSQSLFMTIY